MKMRRRDLANGAWLGISTLLIDKEVGLEIGLPREFLALTFDRKIVATKREIRTPSSLPRGSTVTNKTTQTTGVSIAILNQDLSQFLDSKTQNGDACGGVESEA